MDSRRGFLFLAAFSFLICEAKAMNILQIQKSTDLSLEASITCKEMGDFYYDEGQCCQKCPPGYQVENHCTSTTNTTCRPCDKYTYVKYPNAEKTCHNCKTCRQLDQVEVHSCNSTSDTQCLCKNGTFCSPTLPCEVCQTCTTRCNNGEFMVQPCTPTSDIQCHPYATTPTPPSTDSGNRSLALILVISSLVMMAVFILVMSIKYKKRFCCWWKVGEGGSAVSFSGCKTVQQLLGNYCQGQNEKRDNVQNETIDAVQLSTSQNDTPSCQGRPELVPLCPSAPTEMTKECNEFSAERERNLIPANGNDPAEVLRQSFEIFIKEVPMKEWRRYMRALHLTDNEITRAEMNDQNLYEQQFQMLQTWLNKGGKEMSLNTLLETLVAIELRGIEMKIRAALTGQGLYIYQE